MEDGVFEMFRIDRVMHYSTRMKQI